MTLVEALIASLVLAVGVIGSVGAMDAARTSATRAEARETAAARAEREVERLRAVPWEQLALTSTPGSSADPRHPGFYVRSGPGYQWDHTTSSRVEPLVVNGVDGTTGGTVAHETTWAHTRMGGKQHVFITWVDDACCAGTKDLKRITVATTVDGPSGPSAPIVVSTLAREGGT